jgi:mycothiol synthase
MIRAFEKRDYPRLIGIGTAIEPDDPPVLAALQYRDRTWEPAYRRHRLVAERDAQVVGWGQVGHMWWAYHPRRFTMRLEVDPAVQGQGIGSALHERLMGLLGEWEAELVRTDTPESRPRVVAWLQRRGYSVIQRNLQLRLRVADCDLAKFGPPPPDIEVTTMAAYQALRGERAVRDVYDLEIVGGEDEPRPDSDTSMSFDRFVLAELEEPFALADGHFLAMDGERVVGLSRLARHGALPGVLGQGFTTVHPDYRRHGIALALKLHTVRYALSRGYHEIRTGCDDSNPGMLHINYSLGFRQVDVRLIFEKRFA